MESIHDIISLRRRELLGLWAIFTLWAGSQFLFRFAHGEPFSYKLALDYAIGFSQYMLGPWVLLIVISLCGYILGRSLIRLVARGIEFRTDLEESTWAVGVGLGLIAIITFLLGLARMLYPFTFVFLGILVLAYGYKHIAHLWRLIRYSLQPLGWNFLDLLILMTIVVLFLNSFLNTGNPSTGWDAMNSHLCAPKFYLRDHAVTFFPWINFNNFPQIQEMLLMLQMMVFPDPGTSFMYFFMLLTFAVTYMIGERYFGRTTGLLAVLFLFLIQRIMRSSSNATVEHLLIFYGLLLIQAFLAWYETGDRRWLVLAGIAGGFACGVKYTGMESVVLIFVLIVAAMFLPLRNRERELLPAPSRMKVPEPVTAPDETDDRHDRGKGKSARRRSKTSNSSSIEPEQVTQTETVTEPGLPRRLKPAQVAGAVGIVLLWTVIFACPWYIRNLVLFGNPFFPFFESIFGGLGLGTLNDIRDQLTVDHEAMLKYFRFDLNLENLIQLPWNFTMHHNHPSTGRHPSPGTVGPFFLALTPTLFFVRRWGRVGILLGIYIVLFLSYWFLLERLEHQRYIMSTYPLFAILVAWGTIRLFNLESFNIRKPIHIACTLLMIVMAFGMFYRTTITQTGTSLHFTEDQRQTFLENHLAGWPLIKFINDEIEAGSPHFTEDTIIYGIGIENRRYYSDFPLYGGLFGYASHFELMEHASTGRELYEYLDGYGCEFFLYSQNTVNHMEYAVSIRLPDDETFGEYFEKLGWSADYHLYHLLGPGVPRLTGSADSPEEYIQPE